MDLWYFFTVSLSMCKCETVGSVTATGVVTLVVVVLVVFLILGDALKVLLVILC